MEMPLTRVSKPDATTTNLLEAQGAELFGVESGPRASGLLMDGAIRFRGFLVLPGARQLLRDGQLVDIGGRAFDLLLVLLRSRGALVTKDEIVRFVWPSTVVEESNLRFQMATLRKALDADRDVIKTIPGRGYLFVDEGDVTGTETSAPGTTLPIASRAPAPRPPKEGFKASSKPEKPIVVIIDDDKEIREALHGLLRSAGLQVEAFVSVQDFLEKPRLSPPACLVLDVWLPGRNGLEFQADLAQAGMHVPVIFISGHADVHMSVRAMKGGAVEFLTKPVRHQDLLDAIHLAVASATPMDDYLLEREV